MSKLGRRTDHDIYRELYEPEFGQVLDYLVAIFEHGLLS